MEFLIKDFYKNALAAKVVSGPAAAALRHGRSAAGQHAAALSDLLTGAGDVPPLEEDFTFDWPAKTFRSQEAMVATGVEVLGAVLAAYQTAAVSVSEPSYGVLFASLAASLGQQHGTLSALSSHPGAEPFPIALDLEDATKTLEKYFG